MWIGSLQNCENEPLGVKCKTCVKFLGIYTTYDVQILVEKTSNRGWKKLKAQYIYGSEEDYQFTGR